MKERKISRSFEYSISIDYSIRNPNGSIVLVVLDSKDENRVSATLSEAQEVMAQLDCITATNLDGGKSTTMYYNGEVINNPSFVLGERTILSGFIVK